MFWSHNSHSPQIDSILAKEDLTLNELFNQESLFQELKSPNKNLIEFITRSDMLTELVRLVTEEPSEEIELKERYKQANLACEVLTTDIPQINEKLSERLHLTRLYSFLDADPPLNPLLASFFARTFSMLISRKHDQNWYSYQYTCLQVLDFLKSQESGFSKLVRHMDTSSIMELTFKLLTQIEGPELQNTLLNLVEQESIIEKLIDLLHPSVDEDRNHNVSNLLVDTIYKMKDDLNTTSGDTTSTKRRDSYPILDKIKSEPMVKKLLDNIFGGQITESSIVAGVNVLLALICPPPMPAMGRRDICDDNTSGAGAGDPAKAARSLESIRPILLAIVPYLPFVHQLLLHPLKREPVKLTCGTLDPPLGQARLALVRLVAVLVLTYTPEINEELDRLDTINVLLDLFFDYRWNNFLHTQVVKCLNIDFTQAFVQTESSDPFSPGQAKWDLVNPLVSNIFIKCHILDRLITGARDNEAEQSKGLRRRGYMGHLMTIAGQLCKALQDNEVLKKWVEDHLKEEEWSSWTLWVDSVLAPSIAASSRCLGGTHPMYQVHGSDVSELADDLIDQISLIKLKEDYSQIPDDQVKSIFYSSSNQPEFSLVFYPDFSEHSSQVSSKYLNMLQDDSSTDCEAKFQQICSNKMSFWHELPDSHDNSLDASTTSSDEEDKEDDDDNEIWSSCNSMEPDASDPWSTAGTGELNNDDDWADFGSAVPVSYPDVLLHRSAAVHAAQIANLLDSSDDRLEEDEEPPQVFEVSPEPGDEGDDGGCPPPLPSSPPPPLPASPPPLPSAVPEAPPVLAAQGDSRMPRPLAPPSDPPPPPPTQRVEAVVPQVPTESPEQPVSSELAPQTVVTIPPTEVVAPAPVAETAQVTEPSPLQQTVAPEAVVSEKLESTAPNPSSSETLVTAPEPVTITSPPAIPSSTSEQSAASSVLTSSPVTTVTSSTSEQSAGLSEPVSSEPASQNSETVPLPEVPQVTASQPDSTATPCLETSTQSLSEDSNSSIKSAPR